MGRLNHKTLVIGIYKRHHLPLGVGVAGFLPVIERCLVAVMTVGNDAGFRPHHLDKGLDGLVLRNYIKPMTNIFLIGKVQHRRLFHCFCNDLFGCAGRVIIKHKNLAKLGRRRPHQVQAIGLGAVQRLLVRADSFAEGFQTPQSDNSASLVSTIADMKILNIPIQGLLRVIDKGSTVNGFLQIVGCAGINIRLFIVFRIFQTFCCSNNIKGISVV